MRRGRSERAGDLKAGNILLLHQSSQVVVGRSWGCVRVFHYRAIRVRHGIQGEFSMMVAIEVDMPLMRSF